MAQHDAVKRFSAELERIVAHGSLDASYLDRGPKGIKLRRRLLWLLTGDIAAWLDPSRLSETQWTRAAELLSTKDKAR